MIDLIRVASEKNWDALILAEQAHRGQFRRAVPGSDDVPYVLHSVAVMEVLAAVGGDRNLVAAGALHDVVEDTGVTLTHLAERFGDSVATLVAAVTKGHVFRDIQLEHQAAAITAQIQLVTQHSPALTLDAYALKGADLLANMSNLVWGAEREGLEHFTDVLIHSKRAPRKIRHYLDLAGRLAQLLIGTRYDRLSDALDERASELQALLLKYEETLTPRQGA